MVQDLQKRVQLVQRTITGGKVIEKRVGGEVESAPPRRSQGDLDGKYESQINSKRKNRTDDQDARPPKKPKVSTSEEEEDKWLDTMLEILEEEPEEKKFGRKRNEADADSEVKDTGENAKEGWCKVYHKGQNAWHLGYQLADGRCDIHLFKRQNSVKASARGVRYQPIIGRIMMDGTRKYTKT